MQPGYELDKAVAEACGFPTRVHDEVCIIGVNRSLEGGGAEGWESIFRPAADWNDAMLAAEKCGLFRWEHGPRLERCDKGWRFMAGSDRVISEHEAGTAAICLAILKLKGIEP